MAQENGNIDSIIEQIVCTSLIGDKEYQNTDDKAKRKYLYDQQTEMVNETIDQMCKLIVSKLPKDIVLPVGLRTEVASQMLVEVTQNPAAVTTGFKFDEKAVMKSLNLPVQYEEIGAASKYNISETITDVMIYKENFEQLNNSRENIMNDLLKRAWSPEGTQEEKNAYAASNIISNLDLLAKNGKGLESLSEREMMFYLAALRQIAVENGIDAIQGYLDIFKIPRELIYSEESSNYTIETSAKDLIEAIQESKINDGCNKFLSYVRGDDDNSERATKDYRKNLAECEYQVDSLLEAMVQIVEKARWEGKDTEGPNLSLKDTPRVVQILQDLRESLFNKEINFKCDNYTLGAVLFVANDVYADNPEEAKKLIEAYNERLREQGFEEINYERFVSNRDLTDLEGNPLILHIQMAAMNEKYGEDGNLEEFIKDFNNGKIYRPSGKELKKEDIAYSKDDVEFFKKAKKKDLLEMYEKFGLEYALTLGYQGIDPQRETEKRIKMWVQVLEEECSFDNVLNRNSIIKIEDAEIIDKYLTTEQPKIETENQKRYYENLNRLSKQLKITKELQDNGLLSALELGYDNLSAEENSKEDKKMWYQIMLELCDAKNGIVKTGDIGNIETHLQNITKEDLNGDMDDVQRNYIMNLSEQLKLMREENRIQKIISADNVSTDEVLKGIANQVNLINNSKYSQIQIKQSQYLYDKKTGKPKIEVDFDEQDEGR